MEAGVPARELTAAEQQVADLVALGRRNDEVAGALGIGAKTVEAHLTRIYRKLAIRSRTELAVLLTSRRDAHGKEAPRP